MTRNTVFIAAEIAGYSRLLADDAQETQRRLAAGRVEIDALIVRSGGTLIGTAHELLRAEFPTALQAVQCAIAIQDTMRARNAAYPPSRQLQFRIGVASVEPELMQLRAAPCGICVSRAVRDEVADKLPIRFAETPDADAFKVEIRREDGSYETPRAPPPPKPAAKIPWALPVMVAVVGGLVIASGVMIYQAREDLRRSVEAMQRQNAKREDAFDINRLSWLTEGQRVLLAHEYASAPSHKALTLSANNQVYVASGKANVSEAKQSSSKACSDAGNARCVNIATDDVTVVAFPASSKVTGIFVPETSAALAPVARNNVSQRLAKATGGWSAIAAGTKGLPGIALDAPSESDATAAAREACAEQDVACRVIAIGPFAVEAN